MELVVRNATARSRSIAHGAPTLTRVRSSALPALIALSCARQDGYGGPISTATTEIGMRRLFLGFAFALLVAPAAGEQTLAPSISAIELSARREVGTAPIVIDVRTPEEFVRGHIPGAVNISWKEPERIAALDAPNGIALYCMVGPRARKGEAALLARGIEGVLHIEGGLAAWMSAALPVDGAN